MSKRIQTKIVQKPYALNHVFNAQKGPSLASTHFEVKAELGESL